MTLAVDDLGSHYLEVTRKNFRDLKALADKALAQIKGDQFHHQPDQESNSVAIIMKHMSGNMLSRWRDFLTSDGEKPTRHRDQEFIDDFNSIEQLNAYWAEGWQCLFETLDSLKSEDLLKTVYIRTEPHTVVQALNRQISHYGYHVGQIVYLCKHLQSTEWQTLTIARGKSSDFIDNPWKAKS